MVLGLVTVATSTSPCQVVVVNLGPLNVLIVTGEFLKMSLMDKMTSTCVVIQIAVPQMDLGVIPLTLMCDGNTATCQNAVLGANFTLHYMTCLTNWLVRQ